MTVVTAGVDTFTLSTEPDAAHNTLGYLTVQQSVAQAFVYHPLTAVPSGATLVSATLRLYTQGSWGITPTVTAQAADSAWAASQVTFNSHPGVTGTVTTVSHASSADADLFQFDVTAQVQSMLTNGGRFGFVISRTDGGAAKSFYSIEDPTHPPTLELVWTTVPSAPSNLKPSGGRVVSKAKPLVKFDATDVAAVQVQIDNTTGAFTSPLFDSGTVLSTAPELDLSTTAYGGMTAGTDYTWRARVRNSSGIWSAWSAISHMSYVGAPSVNITNPSTAAYGIVLTDTPTVTWGIISGTQSAYTLTVTTAADPLTILHQHEGTTATSYQIPPGIVVDSSNYVVNVAVTDSQTREALPGAPIANTASQTFTFQGSAALKGPDSLSAEQISVSPFIELTWTRNNDPDSWQIRRDAEIISGQSDAGQPNGPWKDDNGDWHYRDYTASGGDLHHYRVEAKVGDQVSNGSPTFDIQTAPEGVWLADPWLQEQVCLWGTDPGQWTQPEISAAYYPLRGSDSVRVTEGQRGYEADLTGYIRGPVPTETGVPSATNQYKILQRMRNNPTRTYVVATPYLAINATLSGIVPSPAATVDQRWNVAVHVEQQGTLLWVGQGEFVDPGTTLLESYDYEEGTNGAALTTTTNVGSINTIGSPKYQTSAAVHGAMGFNIPGPTPSGGGAVEYNIPLIGQAQVYFTPRYSSGSGSLVQLRGTSDVNVAYVNLRSGGNLGIADSGNSTQATSHGTAGWTLNKTARAVIQWTWASNSLTINVYLYTSYESSYPADSFTATFPSTNAPNRLYVGNGTSSKSTDYDSVDTYIGNAVLPEPRVPNSQPEPIYTYAGAPSPNGMVMASRVLSASSIDLAWSTSVTGSGDPNSPTYVGAQTIDANGLVKHTITGLSPATKYYAKLAQSAGVFVGDLITFKTLPAASGAAFSVKMAVGSCQQNKAGSTNTAAWDDIAAWGPDLNVHLGDYHYGGGRYADATDWTQHMETFSDQTTGIPAMRQALELAPFIYMSDDHEFSDNNEDSGGGGPWSQSRAANILANQNMLAMYPIGASGAPAAKKSLFGTFMLGAHVQVIMLDAESLQRSPALNDDTGALDANGRAVKTFIGDEQETLLRNALLAPVAVNLIFCGKSLVGNDVFDGTTRTVNDWDKPWNYPTWRSKLVNYINTTTKTGGGAIKVAWIGADRHANAYLGKSNTTLPGHPCVIASGYEQDSLSSRPGETYTAQYGFGLHTQVRQYMQIVVSDDNAGTVTVTWKSREVHNLTTNVIVDGLSYTDTWTY